MKYSELSLSTQLNLVILALIIILSASAGYFVISQSATALLEVQEESLEHTVKTSAELLGTPFLAMAPIVAKQADSLSDEFSGTFRIDSNQRERVGEDYVPQMYVNGQKITNDFRIVDQFSERWGSPATVFQRVGNDFLRVSTSLKKGDGSRAFGTWLGKSHPGYHQLMSGQTYVGYARLFGKHYITQYNPVVVKGEVIALLFVGVDTTAGVESAFSALNKIRVGETGYLFIVNSEGEVILHPTLDTGTNLRIVKAADGSEPFGEMVDKKEGSLSYSWENKEGQAEENFTVFSYSDDWKWIIAGGAPVGEITASADSMAIKLSLILALGTIVIGLSVIFLARTLLSPLNSMVLKIEKIGSGELIDHGLVNASETSANEVDRINTSMHAMVNSLRSVVSNIADAGKAISGISASVYANAENQKQTSSQLSSESEQSATGIEELSTSFREVAETINNAADNAREIDATSKESSEHMGGLLQSTETTANRINEVCELITDLSSNVKDITQTAELIQGIAEQTNLLALNAAIEAARAGEQGRGFAVVADEVRNLAKRTQNSTREIGLVVGKFISTTESATNGMNSALADMEYTRNKTMENNELLSKVSGRISDMNTELETIASAVTEQSAVADQVAERQSQVNTIATSSCENSSVMLESAAKLIDLAEKLKGTIVQFNA